MRQIESPLLRLIAAIYFGIKRGYYRLRYPRVRFGRGVSFRGRLEVRGKVRVTIGDHSRLRQLVQFSGRGTITVGSNTLLNGCWIGCMESVSVGDDCLISDCNIVDTDYHNLPPDQRHQPPGPHTTAPITIERNAWVGARAMVLKGVTIGADSVVGAGTVVRESVPPRVVVIGNPQQVVKKFE
ncbi:MAG: acyltransferase [Streptosporangiales bacterium]|nr:acyltransferase [Streptosporangiales bacterium]